MRTPVYLQLLLTLLFSSQFLLAHEIPGPPGGAPPDLCLPATEQELNDYPVRQQVTEQAQLVDVRRNILAVVPPQSLFNRADWQARPFLVRNSNGGFQSVLSQNLMLTNAGFDTTVTFRVVRYLGGRPRCLGLYVLRPRSTTQVRIGNILSVVWIHFMAETEIPPVAAQPRRRMTGLRDGRRVVSIEA